MRNGDIQEECRDSELGIGGIGIEGKGWVGLARPTGFIVTVGRHEPNRSAKQRGEVTVEAPIWRVWCSCHDGLTALVWLLSHCSVMPWLLVFVIA